MLRLTNLSVARGLRVLYENASVVASDGDRIALVGENGCGKSSLFAVILGQLSPEDGFVEAPSLDRIAHVEQSVTCVDACCLDYVLSGHAPLVNAKKEYEASLSSGDAMREATATAALAELNEGAIRAQAQTIMAGLGFLPRDSERKVSDFSGGWRNRLSLARALMCPADLLLLDEPTNHLDMDSLIWLEAWLRRVRSTVIIISHDREFLDRSVTTTWSIEDNKLVKYSGNYSFFEQSRIERLRQQDAAAKAYERQAAHLTAFIERFRYKATKARQAQSRIKMLDKLQAIEPVRAKSSWRFEFPQPLKTPEQLVTLDSVDAGYGDNLILKGVNLPIRSGERIGVLGVNGAGKSTLIKTIVGSLQPKSGTVRPGQGLAIGYFAQHQLDQLDMDSTPLQEMKRKAPLVREQELRDHLGKYRFSGDFAEQMVGSMSGGEKARLALCLIAWDKPNLLVLDEPTNHLDMATREALTMALSTFEGTLVLVSHDRHLLRTACDKLILVHEGSATTYEGDLDDYAKLVLEHRKAVLEAEKSVAQQSQPQVEAGVNRRELRRQEAQERARIAALRKPLQKKLDAVEAKMGKVSDALKALDEKIADADWYGNADQSEISNTMKERGELAAQLEELEMQWMELGEEIEAIK